MLLPPLYNLRCSLTLQPLYILLCSKVRGLFLYQPLGLLPLISSSPLYQLRVFPSRILLPSLLCLKLLPISLSSSLPSYLFLLPTSPSSSRPCLPTRLVTTRPTLSTLEVVTSSLLFLGHNSSTHSTSNKRSTIWNMMLYLGLKFYSKIVRLTVFLVLIVY